MDIKELATLTAAEMDDVYLRNVPAIVLEQYCTRLIAAYLAEQEEVVRVVDGGGELHLPKLQWVSANHSLETPIGSKLFTAPPLPAIPDERIATLEQQNAKLVVALKAWDALIQYNYSGSREAMSAMQQCAFDTADLLSKVKQP